MSRRGWSWIALLIAAAVVSWWRLAPPPPGIVPPGPAAGPAALPVPATAGTPPAGGTQDSARRVDDRTTATVDQGLTGRIVGPRGEPSPGMRLAVVATPPMSPFASAVQAQRGQLLDACAETTSRDDGGFTMPVPVGAVGQPLEVWVYGERRGDTMLRVPELAVGEWRDVGSIAVPSAASVRGSVVAADDGRPIGGATITAWPSSRARRLLPGRRGEHRVVSDGEGRFEFFELAVGMYDFSATAPGHARADLPHRHVQAAEPTFLEIALDPGAVLRGRVVDPAGRPIAAAQVLAEPLDPARTSRPTGRSDQNGGFEVFGVAAGEWRVTVGAIGHRSATVGPVTASGPDVVVVLAPQGGVALTLTGADGGRLTRCTVTPWPPIDRPGAALRALPPREVEAVDGVFMVDGLDPGQWQLEVVAPGHAKAFAEVADVRAAEFTQVALLLPRGAALVGRVLDAAGRPVARVVVQAQADAEIDGGAAAVLRPLQVRQTTAARGVTTAAGAFAFDHLAAGTYQLRVDVPGEAPWYRRGLGLADGDRRDLGAVTVPRGVEVGGAVTGGAGTPAPVFVQVQSLGDGALPAGHVFEAAVGGDGVWTLPVRLPAGRYAAVAGRRLPDNKFLEDADRVASRVEFGLVAGEAARQVALRLPP